jgi:uncharacterized membrane protein YgcG
MEEDDIINNDFLIDPRAGAGISGIATSAEPLLAQGSRLADIQEIEPGAFVDRTSVTSLNDLFNYYLGGMPSQQPIAETPVVEAPVVEAPVVDTGTQDQATGDLGLDTTFQDAGATDVPGTIGTLGSLTEPTTQIAPTVNLLDEFGIAGDVYADVPPTTINVPALDLSGTSEELIDQGVIETPQEFYGRTYDTSPSEYDLLDQEEQNLVDQQYGTAYGLSPAVEPAPTLRDVPLLGVQAAFALKDAYDDATAPSLSETIDFDTYADPSVDAEENQPYNQDFVTQVSGPVETNQLSMMQEYYNKPIEERIAETTGYNPQDISLAGFDLKGGATPENVQAVIDILNTVGAVASLGSTEAVKKAAVEIIKREAARKTTKAVIGAATSLQLDDSSEPTLSEADQEFAETGDYDVYSGDTGTTSGPDYSGGVTTGTTFDAEDEGGSDDTSSSSSQDQGETSSDAGFSESRGRDTDVQQSGTTDSGGSSGGGGGKIVCTMMNETYGFGSFRNKIWQKYAKDNLTREHEKGYHKIFLPLVRLSKTNIVIRKILEHIAVHRTIDIRQEARGKTHILGRVYRKVLEPICYLVGKYAKR